MHLHSIFLNLSRRENLFLHLVNVDTFNTTEKQLFYKKPTTHTILWFFLFNYYVFLMTGESWSRKGNLTYLTLLSDEGKWSGKFHCCYRECTQRQNVIHENSSGYNSSVQQDTVNTISLKWPLNSCWFS